MKELLWHNWVFAWIYGTVRACMPMRTQSYKDVEKRIPNGVFSIASFLLALSGNSSRLTKTRLSQTALRNLNARVCFFSNSELFFSRALNLLGNPDTPFKRNSEEGECSSISQNLCAFHWRNLIWECFAFLLSLTCETYSVLFLLIELLRCQLYHL